MRLKNLICIGLSIAMIASAAGCGSSVSESPSAGGQTAAEAEAEASAASAGGAAGAEQGGGVSSMSSTVTAATGAETAAESSTAAAAGAGSTAAAAAEDTEISPEDVSVTWEDSHVYKKLTLGTYDTITTYGVKGYEDVPFIKASEYLELLFEGRQRTAVENGIMTVSMNGTEAVIDPAEDTIRFDNPARLRSAGDIDGAIIGKEEYNVATGSVKNKSVQTEARPVTVSLKEYHMPVIPYEDDILMPFLALQNTFGSMIMQNELAYNGRDYYNAVAAEQFMTQKENASSRNSPYAKALYSGPFSEKTKTTQAYADYGYYSICLLLDLTFGHKEEKNISSFDEYFTRMNAKPALCSTRPDLALVTEFMLFNYLFDSGHDSVLGIDTVFGTMDQIDKSDVKDVVDEISKSDKGRELFKEEEEVPEEETEMSADLIIGALLEKGLSVPEVVPLIAWGGYLAQAKPEDYGDQRLDYAGDTAVIYFDAFKDSILEREPSYYLDPVKKEDEETCSFAFFYNCFEDIKKHDEVKNVVINICDNGGGSAAALVYILGFLSEDGEVKFTDRDILAGNYREEYYHVDTNLDGIADDQDGFGGQYDFYIMCSGSSYSCGNALPYFAQQGGLAKIIGTKPGGGDCVLGSFIDAYGHCAAYSGMLKLGTDDGSGFVSNEKATEPDLNMMPTIWDIVNVPWFDPEGIADAVHQYQEGKTELVYSDEESGENMSKFLTYLFETISKKMDNSLETEDNSGAGESLETEENTVAGENLETE